MISVVIPTHNRPRSLCGAIGSLASQDDPEFEVVVVDDGSQEPVDDRVFELLHPATRHRLLRNGTPTGGNAARNRGVRAAKGEFVAFLDDDDRFESGKVGSLKRAIAENPSADVLYHPARIVLVREGASYISKPSRFAPGDDVFRYMLVKNHVGGTSMVACRRDALIEAGLFDEILPAQQDYEMWLRLARCGASFHMLAEVLSVYTHDTARDSITKQSARIDLARAMIEERYREGLQLLSRSERRRRAAQQAIGDVRRSHLNRRAGEAAWISLLGVMRTRDPRLVALFLLSLTGSRVFLRVTARLR
jgi:glycosyltransferase involved in cell wall biosynthesis